MKYTIPHSFLIALRVPLTSNDDDDDDDDNKEKTQCNNKTISKTSPDTPSLVSTRRLSTQHNLESLFHKEKDQNVYGLNVSEHISSVVDTLPKGEIFFFNSF